MVKKRSERKTGYVGESVFRSGHLPQRFKEPKGDALFSFDGLGSNGLLHSLQLLYEIRKQLI